MRPVQALAALLTPLLVLSACGGGTRHPNAGSSPPAVSSTPPVSISSLTPTANSQGVVNIYSHDQTMSASVAGQRPLIYVPNHGDGTVTVIDPSTYKVIDTFATGNSPQHVVPAYNLQLLYATNDENGNSLTPISPYTGKRAGPNIPVADPYNMYWTPDGTSAIVVAEALQRLDFRDPRTFALKFSIPVTCAGIDHIDFSADLTTLVATCEFAHKLVEVSLLTHKVLAYLSVPGQPQDIKLDPAGKVYYVAAEYAGGVDLIDATTFRYIGFLPTGPEAHGLYMSRDSRYMYVTNRGGTLADPTGDNGSVSVIDVATEKVVANWPIPHGTPDMGNVSADGKVLWLSGRRSNEVYALDTTTGRLLARIPVGREPHGLAVWPQPGRFCLGHTGVMR